MKTIKEVTNNTAIIRFVEHNNKKFKLTYDNRNGTPLGFDYRFKADILKEDTWNTIREKARKRCPFYGMIRGIICRCCEH